ncbi:hypothetical protein pb186bvf_003642 [Paramecium bursaria]
MLNLILFCFSIITSQAIIKLALKKTFKTLSATIQIEQLNVELSLTSFGKYTTLYCQDLKSLHNFCTKLNNTFLPCENGCKLCQQNQCLGEQNYETGEFAKFIYQEITIDGLKVKDKIQVFSKQALNQTGSISIAKNSYLINKLVEQNKMDFIISFKNCLDDMQLIMGQDISKSDQKLQMLHEEEYNLTLISLEAVGINSFYIPHKQQVSLIFIELNYFTFSKDLADNIFQLVFGVKAGNMISPCMNNFNELFNISFIFENNQTILLQPDQYYFKQNNQYCIPMAGNEGYPVFSNTTLVTNYKDNYFKIDQTLCPKIEKIEIPQDTHDIQNIQTKSTNFFSFYFIILYIILALFLAQIVRILLLRNKRRNQMALIENSYVE